MSFKMRSTSGSADVPEKGTYLGRVVGMVNLDHQPGYKWAKGEVEAQYKMMFIYELPNSRTKDDRPHWVDEDFKISDHEKSTMYKRVTTLDPNGEITGNGEDLTKLIGTPCMIEVDISDKGWPKVKNVTGTPAGMPVPELDNDSILFDFDEPDYDIFCRLRKLTRMKLKSSLNFEGSELQKMIALKGDPDEDDNESSTDEDKY